MDDANGRDAGDRNGESGELIPRPPDDSDLVELCRHLNEAGADYLVIGGFASHRAKDAPDLVFLREYFKARGEEPPEV